MSDQNQFDEYKKKLLQYWGAFLAVCAELWGKAKIYAGKAAAFLRHHGKRLAQQLAVYVLKAREWFLKAMESLRRNGKQLAQKLAAFALKVREEIRSGALTQQIKTWFAAQKERFLSAKTKEPAALPEEPEAVQALPQPEEVQQPVRAEEPKPAARAAEPANVQDDRTLVQRAKPYLLEVGAFFGVIGMALKFIVKWIWKLRKVIMAVPVVWAAVKLAMENMDRLPESVGLDIQATGEFARMITRNEAVYWPLGITLFCLLLMFCSKKPLLPWVISIFTLILPWLIWLLNYYA